MIDLPPLQSITRSTDTVEALAASIAEMLAHLYLYAGTELAKHPPAPTGEQLLNRLHEAVGYVDDVAQNTSGPIVRDVLGRLDRSQLTGNT